MLGPARGKLQQERDELGASLDGDLSARLLFVLEHIEAHIQALQRELVEIGDDFARFGRARSLA